ncbi:MAG: LpxD N-terminal domain-containing protein, partial [Phycisphaeraceae bacterium]|nr:LpxD N-terminal domain-containing protein [Phycisphaeraceae bacterium]
MAMTLKQLAQAISAQLHGDGEIEITGCAGLEEAGEGEVSFLANRRYLPAVTDTRAAAVIIGVDQAGEVPDGVAALVADDPYFAFREAMVAVHGFRKHPSEGVSDQATVADSA